MNKKDFAKLCMNYGKEPNEDLFELWNNNLRCYDEDEIKKAMGIIISQDKFFPNLNRFLEVIKDIVAKEDVLYTEDQKRAKMKRLNINPGWLDKELTSEIEEDTDFTNFIKEFRGQSYE